MTIKSISSKASLVVLAACLCSASSLAADKVVLQLRWDHQFQFAGYYAALWQGYYADKGLDVVIRSAFWPDGKYRTVTREVAEGRADFGTGGADILKARDKGAPLVVLASIFQQSPFAFYAKADTNLKSPADLVRLRVAVRKNGIAGVELRAMLRAENIDPALVGLQPIQEKLGLYDLAKGHADVVAGAIFSADWVARKLGLTLTRLHPASYGVDFYGSAIFAHHRLIEERPGLVEKFIAASLKGWEYALTHPQEIADRIAKDLPRTIKIEDPRGFNRFQIEPVQKLTYHPIIRLGHTNPARWQRMHAALKDAGLVQGSFDADELIFDPARLKRDQRERTTTLILVILGLIAIAGFIGWVWSLRRNLDERRRAEIALAEKTTLLETSLENMSQGIVVYDSDLRVSTFNAKYIELLDYPKDLVRVGVPMEEIFRFQAERGDYGSGDVEAHVSERIKSRRSGAPAVELERSLPNGKVIAARREAMPHGGYVTTYTDITERKRVEEECRQLEFQLRQSQKLESIGTMAGGIAHDFNNILTPIVGYCGIMLDEVPEDSPLQRKIQGIGNAAKRAMNLTQKILSFSRQGEQVRAPIEIQAIVKESLDFLRATKPTTITIDQSIDSTCAPVLADATQIQQVIVNLCNNACYAMRESGGRLGVALDMVAISADLARTNHNLHIGSYVTLHISDTGVGMDQKTQEHIFEPFFTTKQVGEGTGLGLAITHEIVASHGGLITVESELGKGTMFKVYLPTTKQSVHCASNSASISEARNERVLFVDDEVENTIVVEEMLGKLGYDVTTATSSIEALELFRADPEQFDLVITDQTMPHMPGDVFARELIGLRPNLPIILITGFSATVSAETSKALGIREFVMKPLISDDLDQAIRRALNHKVDQAV